VQPRPKEHRNAVWRRYQPSRRRRTTSWRTASTRRRHRAYIYWRFLQYITLFCRDEKLASVTGSDWGISYSRVSNLVDKTKRSTIAEGPRDAQGHRNCRYIR